MIKKTGLISKVLIDPRSLYHKSIQNFCIITCTQDNDARIDQPHCTNKVWFDSPCLRRHVWFQILDPDLSGFDSQLRGEDIGLEIWTWAAILMTSAAWMVAGVVSRV